MELSTAIKVFRLSQSSCVDLVKEIIAAHCNNSFLGFSLSLTGQCTYALEMLIGDGLLNTN